MSSDQSPVRRNQPGPVPNRYRLHPGSRRQLIGCDASQCSLDLHDDDFRCNAWSSLHRGYLEWMIILVRSSRRFLETEISCLRVRFA